MGLKVAALVAVLAAAPALAQLGFFDLDTDEATKLHGTTREVLPNCFSTPNGVCGNGGRTIFAPDAKHEGLLAWYTFDDAYALDHSGNALHAPKPPAVGPGHDGRGQSAYFGGLDGFTAPHDTSFDSASMTVSFWMYLLSDSTDSWRVVFRKGDEATDLTPTLLLFPDSRKLHIRLSTTDEAKHGLDSMTAVPLRRWTHVAVTLHYNVIAIYINGIKDNEGIVTGEVIRNTGSWYLGKDNFLPGTSMFMDNFKVIGKALEEPDIQVEASAALPGLGPNFVRLGCQQCPQQTAIQKCAATGGYHLCREMELAGGALMVARAMGYLDMSSEHWTAEDGEEDVSLEKLGLCCLD